MALGPGDVVGSYEVVRRIGEGGTAEVYEVRHAVLGTSHALKVLLPRWVENAEVRARFLQEGRLQSRLDHPSIVRVTDTVAQPGLAGLVMELLVGESLRDRLERDGVPAPRQAVAWTRAVLEALTVAHAAGVTHRDIKPENLFLEKRGGDERIRLLDFGIAKAPEAAHQTSQRGALGTCAYMSPEQVRDPSSVDARTDVFAVGAVLWELLVGQPPFDGKTPYDSMQQVLSADPGRPSDRRSELPGWLDDVVAAALNKDPAERIQSAQAFIAALDAGPRGMDAPRVSTPPARIRRAPVGWILFFLVLFGGPVVVGLGSIVALVAAGQIFRPPRIESLAVTSDACGAVEARAAVWARGDDLEVRVDGALERTERIEGQRTVNVQVQRAPGSTVTVEATLGGRTETSTHTVYGAPPSVTIAPLASTREGAVSRTQVVVNGSCLPPGVRYEVSVDGTLSDGVVPNNAEVWVDTTGLRAGSHLVEVRVIDLEGRTLADASRAIDVEPPPPPGDIDLDGFVSRSAGGDDCDDTNPAIHPGASEASAANGVDENCDGRVDEGTAAYDDDGDGLAEVAGDCDDADSARFPGAREVPDCRDQDCDGEIDEGVTLPQRDDSYEPNDTRGALHDLRTGNKRSFTQGLELVAANTGDEAWFEFYSQDGDFDDWGIDVTTERMPANSAIHLEVFDATGASRGSLVTYQDGEQLQVRGRGFRDDSGIYRLHVVPRKLHADWCPYRLTVTAR